MSEATEEIYINNVSESFIVASLKSMMSNPAYQTKMPFTLDPENTFIKHHLKYLKSHPTLNPDHYLANLRLSLKKKH